MLLRAEHPRNQLPLLLGIERPLSRYTLVLKTPSGIATSTVKASPRMRPKPSDGIARLLNRETLRLNVPSGIASSKVKAFPRMRPNP